MWVKFKCIYDIFDFELYTLLDGPVLIMSEEKTHVPTLKTLFKYWFGCVCCCLNFEEEKITRTISVMGCFSNDLYDPLKIDRTNVKTYFYFLSFVLDYKVSQDQYDIISSIFNNIFKEKSCG